MRFLAGWCLEYTEVEMKFRASEKRVLGLALMLRETRISSPGAAL